MRLKAPVFLAAFALTLAAVACAQQAPAEPEGPAAWVPFEDGAFRLELPDWQVSDSDDPSVLRQIASGDRTLVLSRYVGPPRMVGAFVEQALPDFGFEEVHVEKELPDYVEILAFADLDPPMAWHHRLLYCDGFTYGLSGLAPQERLEAMDAVLEEAVASADCQAAVERPELRPGLIGLIINPPGEEFDLEAYRQAVVEARDVGVQATHTNLTWAELEPEPGQYEWFLSDAILDTLTLEGLRLSTVIEFIHTSVPGAFPPDLEGRPFDDPEVIARAVDFTLAFLERYREQVDYLSLGNEVNIYFEAHPEDLEPYLTLFREVRQAVHEHYPDLPVGTVIAFHEAVGHGRTDLIDAFKEGDFLAYTYYPHDPGFRYDVEVTRFERALKDMIHLSGDTPFIIVENGFSSAPSLGSDEAHQAEYVRAVFDALAEHREAFGMHVWLSLHDGVPDQCDAIAETFVPPGVDLRADEAGWQAFVDYICYLGLRTNDGRPKAAWEAFVEGLTAYRLRR